MDIDILQRKLSVNCSLFELVYFTTLENEVNAYSLKRLHQASKYS